MSDNIRIRLARDKKWKEVLDLLASIRADIEQRNYTGNLELRMEFVRGEYEKKRWTVGGGDGEPLITGKE